MCVVQLSVSEQESDRARALRATIDFVKKPLLILACAALLPAQDIRFGMLPRETVEKRLGSFAHKNVAREPALRALFEGAGCSASLEERVVKGWRYPNLICTMPGESASTIVVGAHYDSVEDGDGVVDNWSGASLLPSLYESLRAVPRKHTFEFIGFTGEERGLIGSRAFVSAWKKTREPEIEAMVNIDTLGLTESEVWVSHANKNLVDLAWVTASAVGLPVQGVNVEEIGETDSESFRDAKIPAITFHSLTQDTLGVLHTNKDTLQAVKIEPYYRSYRLISAYLALLDSKLN